MEKKKAGLTEDKIKSDLAEAMKAKDLLRISSLRMLRAAIENHKIEKRKKEISEGELLQIISKQISSRSDSIEQFTKGGRDDLAKKEKKEAEILKSYLPPQLTESELTKIIQDAIKQTGASSKRDMGKVMGKVMSEVRGKADGKVINQLVAKLLGELEKPT
ncbi:hypothetical protein AC481_05490 [miscellaneous Crenarchaeota group archaeon SMTZ-80]|nr:MAG: hypothetical protein AC481_05490 [miscellaneous Crenarchaeota group archaeon SMTZ-80]